MKNIILSFFLLLSAIISNAQVEATVYWELSGNTNTSYVTNGAVNAAEQTASTGYVIRDYGGTLSSQRVYAEGNGLGYWPNESTESTNRYCEFQVSPRKGIELTPTFLQLRMGNSGGSNNQKASVYYSVDDFATQTIIASNVALPSAELSSFNYYIGLDKVVVSNQNAFKIRVYPWLEGGADSGKYFNIREVKFTGTTTGDIIAELPQVQVVAIGKLSTQTAVFKGEVTNDGGVALDSVGVFITNESGANKGRYILTNEPMSGDFACALNELTAGHTYYAKSFAANAAGISYSDELVFTTLTSLMVPELTTTAVTDIKPNGAVAHGQVTFDGGLEVTYTGFCFSTQASPTIVDATVKSGEGLGKYTAYLPNLAAETKYFVRAYAENNQGIGYGNQLEFTTVAALPDMNMVVDQYGTGDYTTLQDAFNNVPYNYTGNIYVFVKNGIYNEKVILEKGQINVHLMGESRDSTIIRWDDYSGKVVDGVTLGTSTSQTIAIDADDFIAQNISFQNTSEVAQAVALRVKGDRVIFQYCKLLGFQDTYYTWGVGRIYNEDCYIEGTVDFIFGSSIAMFKNCEIRSLRNSPVTAAATPENYKFGYVLQNCTLVADSTIVGTTLGRPWKPFAKTVYIESEQGEHIRPQGWLEWNGNNNHETAYYAEYNCSGEGYVPDKRVPWSHQLTDDEAKEYTIENIFSKQSASPAYYYDWVPEFERVEVPEVPVSVVDLWEASGFVSVYPNPCKDMVTVGCEIKKQTSINIAIYTLDGRLVKYVVRGNHEQGTYEYPCSVVELKTGMYMLEIQLDNKKHSELLLID